MVQKCVLCNGKIEEEFGKLIGTIVRVLDENKKGQRIYVCSGCQKKPKWIENAKVKGA